MEKLTDRQTRLIYDMINGVIPGQRFVVLVPVDNGGLTICMGNIQSQDELKEIVAYAHAKTSDGGPPDECSSLPPEIKN